MVRNYSQYRSKTNNFGKSPSVNSKDRVDFAMLLTLKTTRKAGGPQILSRRRRDQADCGRKLQLHQDPEALRLLQRWGSAGWEVTGIGQKKIVAVP